MTGSLSIFMLKALSIHRVHVRYAMNHVMQDLSLIHI